MPPKTAYDPREMCAGRVAPDGTWVAGFFDRGSYQVTDNLNTCTLQSNSHVCTVLLHISTDAATYRSNSHNVYLIMCIVCCLCDCLLLL
jgi:hypothetical protein